MTEGTRKTERFARELQLNVRLWGFCVAFLGLFRAVLILTFADHLAPGSGLRQIASAMLNGVRYDSVIACCFCALPFVCSLGCLWRALGSFTSRLRSFLGVLFVVTATVLCLVTLSYFREYNDQFNHFFFGLFYDDVGAIGKTIWAEYHPLRTLVLAAGVVAVAAWCLRRLMARPPLPEATIGRLLPNTGAKTIAGTAAVALFVVAARGSAGHRPVQRKDAAVTSDPFVNKTVLNPFTALRYAIKDHCELRGDHGIQAYLPDGDIRAALRLVTDATGWHDRLDSYLVRSAPGPVSETPRHVFLLLMESYEAWPMFPEYESLGLAEELRRLARAGVSVVPFLPASSGTMESLAAIVTGLPDAGVHTNYQPTARRPYLTSLPEQFRRLGYRTRLFYGGYLSWQRIGEFSYSQGFDEVYGGAHMGLWRHGNEWGVDDEYLFGFVSRTVNDDVPSLNLILSTSFHPPFDIDVRAQGFTPSKIPDEIAARCDAVPDLRMLGHFWYADQCLGRFVRDVEESLPRILVAVTGDHAGRRTIVSHPTVAEQSLVPFVLYGPDVLRDCAVAPGTVGTHIDIGPTLVELCAPRGFRYHALGQNILRRRLSVAVGKHTVIGREFIARLGQFPTFRPLPGRGLPDALPSLDRLRAVHDAHHGIAWWAIKRGTALPSPAGGDTSAGRRGVPPTRPAHDASGRRLRDPARQL